MNILEKFRTGIAAVQDELDIIWPTGRNPSCLPLDGKHFKLRGHERPVSIGQVEAHLLFNLVRTTGAKRILEIGTGFGYSSFWMGAALLAGGFESAWLGSLDNREEGSIADAGSLFAQRWSAYLGLSDVIHYEIGSSPEDIPNVVTQPLDLVFIDGNHNFDQPSRDYFGIRSCLTQNALIAWHDIEPKYGVNLAISESIKDGWSLVTFPTSCRLGVSYRSLAGWEATMLAYTKATALELI